jgi:hypothetical protein
MISKSFTQLKLAGCRGPFSFATGASLGMPDTTYPENFVEARVRDPNDVEYGMLLTRGEMPPGGPSVDGVLLTDEEVRAHRAARDRRTIVWRGPHWWRTQHGQALVAWHLGYPARAWNVRLSDGHRVRALKGWTFPTLWRRTVDAPPIKYQWGKLEIGDDDVTFKDVPTPRYEPPVLEGKPNLEMDLANDAAFVGELADIKFALAAWASLYWDNYVRVGGEENGRYIGRDAAAELVAGLRGLGEDGSDFKNWYETMPRVELDALLARVREDLLRLGWRRC